MILSKLIAIIRGMLMKCKDNEFPPEMEIEYRKWLAAQLDEYKDYY